jgi:predicted dehydrogenase
MKIGIIGTDGSHSLAFCDMLNNKRLFENVTVTHIFGLNQQETEAVLHKVSIENVVENTNEMIGQVDGVMIVFRDGNLHLQYAKPFIEAKIPVWIDKPVTIAMDDANELLNLAKKFGGIVMGGSTFKYASFITKIKNEISLGGFGNILTASLCYPADMASPYNGLHFYAPHMIEMALEIFGYDIKNVQASKVNDQNITVIISYERYNIVLNFADKASENKIYIIGDKKSDQFDIIFDGIYEAGLSAFASAIEGGKQPYKYHLLIKSVEILNKIYDVLE